MENVEFVRDETGKLIDILVRGKKVKAGFVRGWRKAEKASYFSLFNAPCTFANPFSGIMVKLNPLESTIFSFCLQWYKRYERGNADIPIQTYDDMKYFLMDLNPDAYYDLLD